MPHVHRMDYEVHMYIDVSEHQFLENLGAESTVSERQDALPVDFGARSVTPCSQSAYETDGSAYATYKEYLFLAILATKSILTCSTHRHELGSPELRGEGSKEAIYKRIDSTKSYSQPQSFGVANGLWL